MPEKIRDENVPKEFIYVADVLLKIIHRENLDKDEIVATLEHWKKCNTIIP